MEHPRDRLRYHVTGAIERGESEAIEAVESIHTTRTPWGEVSHSSDGFVTIVATESETYKWANRVSARWPCSTLAGKAVECAFVSNGDLVDLEGPEDIDGHELNAFVSDTLRAAALSHHPAVKL